MDKIYSCYVFLLLQTNFLQIYTIIYNKEHLPSTYLYLLTIVGLFLINI